MKALRAVLFLLVFGWVAILAFAFLRRSAKKQAAAAQTRPAPGPSPAPSQADAMPPHAPSKDPITAAADAVDAIGIKALETIPGIGQVIGAADKLIQALPVPSVVKDFLRDPLTAQVKLLVAVGPAVAGAVVDAGKAVGGAVAGAASAVGSAVGSAVSAVIGDDAATIAERQARTQAAADAALAQANAARALYGQAPVTSLSGSGGGIPQSEAKARIKEAA